MNGIRSTLGVLLVGLGNLLIVVTASAAGIDRDWQLPYVDTDAFIAFADSRGTVIEYSDGESVRLHTGRRGFPPVHEPPMLYVTGLDGRVSAWHLEERRVLWQRRFEGWIFPPLVRDEAIYVAGQPHRLFKLDRDDGSTLASVPLPNEAVYSPVSWRDGRIGVGVYARMWLTLEPDGLQETQRFLLPAPAITASPDGYFLSQNGDLHKRRNDGNFELLRRGQAPVDWFQTTHGQLNWASGDRFLRLQDNRLSCLASGAPIVHWRSGIGREWLTVTNFNGTYRMLQVSQDWGNPDLQTDKENTNEKMVDANRHATDRHHDQLRPC